MAFVSEFALCTVGSGTTQVFRDIAADQSIEVTEFAGSYRTLAKKEVPEPR